MDGTNLQELFEHVSWVLTKQEMELFGFIAWKFWQDIETWLCMVENVRVRFPSDVTTEDKSTKRHLLGCETYTRVQIPPYWTFRRNLTLNLFSFTPIPKS